MTLPKTKLLQSALIGLLIIVTSSVSGNNTISKFCKINHMIINQSTDCETELVIKVENQQVYKDSPIYYLFQLKNIGQSTNKYQISADDFKDFEENPGGSPTNKNVKLDQIIEDKDHNVINGEVTLNPGETIEFYIKLSAFPKPKYGRWNGTKISVTSDSCPNLNKSLIIHTYISIPDDVQIGYNSLNFSPNPLKTNKSLFLHKNLC